MLCVIRARAGLYASVVVLIGATAMLNAATTAASMTSSYIVVLKPAVSPTAKAAAYRVTPTFVYRSALNGFSAPLTGWQSAALSTDPDVSMIVGDRDVSISPAGAGDFFQGADASNKQSYYSLPPGQVTPTGLRRIGGLLSPTARVDGVRGDVDVDIAVIDSGIALDQPDLKVVGGYNCSSGKSYADEFGHGTAVAGVLGAIDDGNGVVGVAPGARLWSVRVLGNGGKGSYARMICGVDWVTAHASTIEVANMSVRAAGADDGNCGRTNKDPLHLAVCNLVAVGVVFVVAAGNDAADAAAVVPAAYDEAITVSGLIDFDGSPGGLGSPTCGQEVDDTLAYFSNFGADIDIAAPSVCITTTAPGGLFQTASGTSVSAPYVAGAAALYKATHPSATPAAVKSAILAAREPGPIPDDPDPYAEGVVNVSTF
jgi:subtilisin